MRANAGKGIFKLVLGIFLTLLLTQAPVGAQNIGIELWQTDIYDPPYALTVISDVSDDGIQDVVVGTQGDIVFCINTSTGELWWSFFTSGTVWSVQGIGDVDSDGQEDVVIGTADNKVHCVSGGTPTGEAPEIWSMPTDGDVWALTRLPDINADGCDEAIAGDASNKIVCYSGISGEILWDYDTGGDIWTVDICSDINGDSYCEVIAGSADNRVYCLNGLNGQLLWRYNVEGDVWVVSEIEDVNSDSKCDILAGAASDRVVCLSGAAGSSGDLIWQFNTGADVRCVVPAMDINSDDISEVAVGSADDNLYILNGFSGNQILVKSVSAEVFSIDWISDISRNRILELVCGTAMSTVNCYEGETLNELWLYSYPMQGSIEHIVTIGDINGDSIEDVVAVSNTGMANCLSGAGPIPLVSGFSGWQVLR